LTCSRIAEAERGTNTLN